MLLPSWCLQRLALIAFDHGDAVRVAALLRQLRSLDATSSAMHHIRLGHLMTTAILATLLGEAEAAARLLGAAAVEFFDVAVALPNGAYYVRMERTARERLGDDAYLAAWTAGRRTSRAVLNGEMDRLLAMAGQAPAASVADPAHLTPREREVLDLLVAGRSNQEIADALFIGHRTASTHVTNILAKLGVENRAAAVAYAFQHGLT
jgi:DNA-binding CsgD family transcriptional regulator